METVQDGTTECEACLGKQSETEAIEICPKCRRQILPQLKQPGWANLIGFTHPEPEKEPEPSVPAAKAIRRNKRRFNIRNVEDGLTCYFCPEQCGTPVSKQGLVCGPCGEEVRVRRTAKTSRVHYSGLNGRTAA